MKEQAKEISRTLQDWQDKLATNKAKYQDELDRIDHREKLYKGNRDIIDILPCTDGLPKMSNQVRNIIAELIEAQTDANIPAPKVTALRQEDKKKAKIIEDMLNNELDRIPFERINDMLARTTPLQGSSFYDVEWDNTITTHNTVGDIDVEVIHPKQIIPQAGVYTSLEDMDYFFVCIPRTKQYILHRYGKDVYTEFESDPALKSSQGDKTATSPDIVDQYIAYYRNSRGGVGIFSWVNDEVLIDLPDYWARKISRCLSCGASEPEEQSLYSSREAEETVSGPVNEAALAAAMPPQMHPGAAYSNKTCPNCGSNKFGESELDYEELATNIIRSDGTIIPAYTEQERLVYIADENSNRHQALDSMGYPITEKQLIPTRIPFYKPRLYPIVQQKNVSCFGQFLGESDTDKVADHQNIINILSTKINEKLTKAGSYLGLPPDATIETTARELKTIRLKQPEWADMIKVYNVEADISQDMARLQSIYEEARQAIGITDSYQGRRDTTATSGVAKQFAAAQSAGRLESKRVMKNAAYADIFERIFKLKLAYADEPRQITSQNGQGQEVYETFDRYDFLEQDAAGNWYWNDLFLFGADTTAALAGNRQAMWQEMTVQLQSGALGPRDWRTLALYWQTMEDLHYPNASKIKTYIKARMEQSGQQQGQAGQGQALPRQEMPRQALQGQALPGQVNDPLLEQLFSNAMQGDTAVPDLPRGSQTPML